VARLVEWRVTATTPARPELDIFTAPNETRSRVAGSNRKLITESSAGVSGGNCSQVLRGHTRFVWTVPRCSVACT